jgi:TRAP-type C4-dicarboxylate transport system permease small subunit
MRSIGIPELLVLFGVLLLLGFALILLVGALRWKQSRSVQRSVIDKLPANDLAAMLQTPQGEKLMQTLADAGASPGRSILASVQRGIVVIMTGVGVLVAAVVTQAPSSVWAIALILMFVGIGLLVAALVTHRLAKRWQLFEDRRAD